MFAVMCVSLLRTPPQCLSDFLRPACHIHLFAVYVEVVYVREAWRVCECVALAGGGFHVCVHPTNVPLLVFSLHGCEWKACPANSAILGGLFRVQGVCCSVELGRPWETPWNSQ